MAGVDFAAVKRAVSLASVLDYYQAPGLRQGRDQLEGRCPIHRGRRTDSFRASLSKNVFHRFACQAGGSVLDFVAAMERCSIREAALRLQQWLGRGAPVGPRAPKGELVREKGGRNPPLPFALRDLDYSHP